MKCATQIARNTAVARVAETRVFDAMHARSPNEHYMAPPPPEGPGPRGQEVRMAREGREMFRGTRRKTRIANMYARKQNAKCKQCTQQRVLDRE